MNQLYQLESMGTIVVADTGDLELIKLNLKMLQQILA